MPVYLLSSDLVFPDPRLADDDGLLAIEGDLRPERILLAYKMGIFPWPHSDAEPLLWFCPKERFVLPLNKVHIGRSLRKAVQSTSCSVRIDHDFRHIMVMCQNTKRRGDPGSWITDAMIDSYTQLHTLGYAHCVGVYQDDQLVGGLYGLSLGRFFAGESMFSLLPNASKIGFMTLLGHLKSWDFDFVDCQMPTAHLASFGAHSIPRDDFLQRLHASQRKETLRGKWDLELSPLDSLALLMDRA